MKYYFDQQDSSISSMRLKTYPCLSSHSSTLLYLTLSHLPSPFSLEEQQLCLLHVPPAPISESDTQYGLTYLLDDFESTQALGE